MEISFKTTKLQKLCNSDKKMRGEYGPRMATVLRKRLMDLSAAESLDVHRTSESFVIDPNSMRVLFRGPIDDRLGYESQKPVAKNHYLKDALDAVVSSHTSVAAIFDGEEFLGMVTADAIRDEILR